MGIPGLLPFVRKACRQANVTEFHGRTVAIDVSCLLHRGMFGCMDKISQGQDTQFYIGYVLKYVRSLLLLDIHVVLVFDGRSLPAKKDVHAERRERRQSMKAKAAALMAEGKVDEAAACWKRCTEITQDVIDNTIQACRKLDKVDIIVSPYESDAQMAYLANEHFVDYVLTEDSDLIVFGCEKIIFKLDSNNGNCTLYEKCHLPKCLYRALAEDFDFVKFRRLCILSGCDYLVSGLAGIALTKASEFFAKTSCADLKKILPRIPRYLHKASLRVSSAFIEDFIAAEHTFLYQVVFDPRTRRQVPLNSYPTANDEYLNFDEKLLPFAGEFASDEKALMYSLGTGDASSPRINPPTWSVWHPKYAIVSPVKRNSPVKFGQQMSNSSPLGAFSANCARQIISLVDDGDEEERPSASSSSAGKVCRKRPQLRNSPLKPKKPTALPKSTSRSTHWAAEDVMKMYSIAVPAFTSTKSVIQRADEEGCCEPDDQEDHQAQAPMLTSSKYFTAARRHKAADHANNPFKKPRLVLAEQPNKTIAHSQ